MNEPNITTNLKLKTMVNSDYVQDTINQAVAKGLKIVANRAIVSTLPYTLKDAKGKSPTAAMKKGALNKLKARIKGDIMGDGKVGSGIATATLGNDNEAMIDMKGGGYMPFVVQKPIRKNAKRKNVIQKSPRFLVTNSNLLLNHIYNNTTKRGSKKPMVRFIKKGASYCWTTVQAIKGVVALLQARVGNFLSGWSELADQVGNKKLNSILGNGNHDGDGDAELKLTKNSVHLSATNNAVPPTKQGYANMVESHVERWANESIRNELKYAMAKIDGKNIPKKWYGK